jgi:hypothetical protein
LVFWLVAFAGACGGSAASSDGGGRDMRADQSPVGGGRDMRGADQASGSTLTGTFTPTSGDPCIMTLIKGAPSAPQCTVTEHHTGDAGTVVDLVLPTCDASNFVGPCWSMNSKIGAGCAYLTFFITNGPSTGPDRKLSYSYSCVACPPGSPASGC